MIPRELEAWFMGGPWSSPDQDFHQYWNDVHRGRVQAEPFMRFGTGLHELAHFIFAEPEHMLDPTWGYGPMGDPHEDPTDPRKILDEVQVTYVEEMINTYLTMPWVQHPVNYPSVIVAVSNHKIMPGKAKASAYCQAVRQYRDINSIWNQLQKQYQVLHTLL